MFEANFNFFFGGGTNINAYSANVQCDVGITTIAYLHMEVHRLINV